MSNDLEMSVSSSARREIEMLGKFLTEKSLWNLFVLGT